jgi:hypothetical protein
MRVASSEEYEKGSIFTGSFEHSSKHVEGKKKEEVMHGSRESSDFHKNVQIKGPNKLKRYHITENINKLDDDCIYLLEICFDKVSENIHRLYHHNHSQRSFSKAILILQMRSIPRSLV